MSGRDEPVDEQLLANAGLGLLALLALPPAIYLMAGLVVQVGWYPVWVLLSLTTVPLTLLRLWKAWYPFSFIGAVTPAIDLTDDQLRMLSFLTSAETRRNIWIAGLAPALVVVAGVKVLEGFGIVTIHNIMPGSVIRPHASLGHQMVLPGLFYACSVAFCLVGWPFWRAYCSWARIVRTYPVYPLERFRRDFVAPAAARAGIGGPRRAPTVPVRNPVLRMASAPLRWTQAIGAALFIIGVPALYRGTVTLVRAIGESANHDLAFAAGMMAVASLFLVLGRWLWKR
jgi:hypothetical protein